MTSSATKCIGTIVVNKYTVQEMQRNISHPVINGILKVVSLSDFISSNLIGSYHHMVDEHSDLGKHGPIANTMRDLTASHLAANALDPRPYISGRRNHVTRCPAKSLIQPVHVG